MNTKNIFKVSLIIILFSFSIIGYAQGDGPGEPGGGPGGGDDPIGGGGSAPIGSGIMTLLVMGGLYASGRTYLLKRKK